MRVVIKTILDGDFLIEIYNSLQNKMINLQIKTQYKMKIGHNSRPI